MERRIVNTRSGPAKNVFGDYKFPNINNFMKYLKKYMKART